jgi:GNAT superfamily N-acetyltransferase
LQQKNCIPEELADVITNASGLPYIVAEDSSTHSIIGYSYVSSFRGVKPGYRHSLELSLFCHPDHVRKGVGRAILLRMIDILKDPDAYKEGWFEGARLFDFKPRQLIACMAVDIDMPGKIFLGIFMHLLALY